MTLGGEWSSEECSPSFVRSLLSRVIGFSEVFEVMGVAVVGHQAGLLVHDGLQVHGASPDGLQVYQRIGGAVQPQVDPVEVVPQQHLSAVAVVAVHDINERLAEVGKAEEE